MRWDQIEEQWTAMTRRIRSDRRDGPGRGGPPRGEGEMGLPVAAPAAGAGRTDAQGGYGRLPTQP